MSGGLECLSQWAETLGVGMDAVLATEGLLLALCSLVASEDESVVTPEVVGRGQRVRRGRVRARVELRVVRAPVRVAGVVVLVVVVRVAVGARKPPREA